MPHTALNKTMSYLVRCFVNPCSTMSTATSFGVSVLELISPVFFFSNAPKSKERSRSWNEVGKTRKKTRKTGRWVKREPSTVCPPGRETVGSSYSRVRMDCVGAVVLRLADKCHSFYFQSGLKKRCLHLVSHRCPRER